MIKKAFKMIKMGVIYGLKHPFSEESIKLPKGTTVVEAALSGASYGLTQATIQNAVVAGVTFASLIAIGYVSSKATKADLRVTSVIDNK